MRARRGAAQSGRGANDGTPQVPCFTRAVASLARRSRSRRGLERWLLQRGYGAEEVATALERLEGLGYLDDERFARARVVSRMATAGVGERRAAVELVHEGVNPVTIKRVLRQVVEDGAVEPEPARLSALASRRADLMRSLPPEVALRRLVSWLVRRGFGAGAAHREAKRYFGA